MKARFLVLFFLVISRPLFTMDTAEAKPEPQAWGWAFQKFATNAPGILGGTSHDQFLIDRYVDGSLLPTAAERPVDVANVLQRALQAAGTKDLTAGTNQAQLAQVLKIASEIQEKYPDITVTPLVARGPLEATRKIYVDFLAKAKALHAKEKAQQAKLEEQQTAALDAKKRALAEAKAKETAALEAEKEAFLRQLEERKAALEAKEAAQTEALQRQQAQRLKRLKEMRTTNDTRARLEAAKLAATLRALCKATKDDSSDFEATKFEAEAFQPLLSDDEEEEE